jgi:formylglycine-generating enzyme required for sulfatase activity
MKFKSVAALSILCLIGSGDLLAESASGKVSPSLGTENEAMFLRMKSELGYTDEDMSKVKGIFQASPYMGQGNPEVTRHPVSREECRDKLKSAAVSYVNQDFERICGGKYMAPLYDPAKGEKASDAKSCIDQFEFPNIPCDYPVVWVRAKEAQELCAAVGKRLCDAHEWEGGCHGALTDPDYDFKAIGGLSASDAVKRMRLSHNKKQAAGKRWAFGAEDRKGVCAMNSTKDKACNGGNWKHCGSNTYPAGMFPECVSPLGVYDQHGNAAEHMNLPLAEDQMTSRGSTKLGVTEMKGSWFIFDKFKAHPDWCRWRAPYWHGDRVMSPDSHHNYHLGFRCCKTISSK